MSVDACKSAAHPSVISIPWLINVGVGLLEVPYTGYDPQAIYDHCQRIPMAHPLLAEKYVTHPIVCADHQGGLVAVSFKCKPHTTGPLVAHGPQHGCAVLLIEHIARINEEKPSVLPQGVMLPQEPHLVNPPLGTGFQPPVELLRPTCLIGFCPCHFQQSLHEHPLLGPSHSNWPYTRAISKADEAPRHQRPVGRPGWVSVGHPVPKLPNNMT